MTDKIHVYNTVRMIQPCDYALNRISESMKTTDVDGNITHTKSAHFGRHAIQVFSYFTHPIDIGMQAIVFPILKAVDPFVDVGVDLANKNWLHAGLDTAIIPLKLFLGVFKVLSFEISQLARFAWSAAGLNALINVCSGDAQSEEFFAKRLVKKDPVKYEDSDVTKRARNMVFFIPTYTNKNIQKRYDERIAAAQKNDASSDSDSDTD